MPFVEEKKHIDFKILFRNQKAYFPSIERQKVISRKIGIMTAVAAMKSIGTSTNRKRISSDTI